MSSIQSNLASVLERIEAAKKNSPDPNRQVTLVAVSKTKPIEDIIEAYNNGQRHFGENYVQELEEKATSKLIEENCPDIRWHFIGHLQSNKAKKVAALPYIYAIETVDSLKLAEILNNYMSSMNRTLNIMIQVNTSNEEQKSGIHPNQVVEIYEHIKGKFKSLNILGLMTIGSFEQSTNSSENVDFISLVNCKKELVERLNIDPTTIQLSMGMSHDFEQAVNMGSSNVRVGSLIFGSRS